MLFPFTPRHLRPFFRHRGEGSEGKKHDLIVYVRVRVRARNECVHAKKQRVHERNNVKDMSTGGRRNPKEVAPSSTNCSVIKNQKLPSPFVFSPMPSLLPQTINDMLKNVAQIVHTRHRGLSNFIVNLLAGMATYCFLRYKTLHQYGI